MPSPTNPLARIYTLGKVLSIVILWLKKENQQELDPELVKDFINLACIDVAEILSGAGSDDYGKTATLSDQASSETTTIVTGASYTDGTKTVTKTSHGLTSADVGKRIAMWVSTTRAAITEIASITDDDNFTTVKSLNASVSGTLNYAIFSAHSTTNVDLSSYKIANITKIYDSTNKECVKVGDKNFDNIYRFTQKQNKVFWFKHGQSLFLHKGTSVDAFGTLTMYYNSYPQEVTEEADYLDIRDYYIPLVVAMAKNYCLEHLGITAPESLTNVITSKTREIRENIQREKALAEAKNQGATA